MHTMKRINLAMGIIMVVSFTVLLSVKLTTSTLARISDGTSNTIFYSGARASMAISGNNIYLTWWDNKTGDWQVFSKASNDNGKTFDDAVMLKSIGNSPMKILKAPLSNTISVDTIVSASGDNEFAVWWDNTTGNWEVSFAKSSDGGKTFSDTMNISNSSDARSIGARTAVQGKNVFISWIDIDKNTGQKQVLFRESSDNGQSFDKPIIISGASQSLR